MLSKEDFKVDFEDDSKVEIERDVASSESDADKREKERLHQLHLQNLHQQIDSLESVHKAEGPMLRFRDKQIKGKCRRLRGHEARVQENSIIVAFETAVSFQDSLVTDHKFLRQMASSANGHILRILGAFVENIPRRLSDENAVGMTRQMNLCNRQPRFTPEQRRQTIRKKLKSFAKAVQEVDIGLAERSFNLYAAEFPDVEKGVVASSSLTLAHFCGDSICVNTAHDRQTLESSLVHEFLHFYTEPAEAFLKEAIRERSASPEEATKFFTPLLEGVIESLTKYVCSESGIEYVANCYKRPVKCIEKHLITRETIAEQSRLWLSDNANLISSLVAAKVLPGMCNAGDIIASNEIGHGGDSSASGVLSSSGSGGHGMTTSSDSGPNAPRQPSRPDSHRYEHHGGDQHRENRSTRRSRSNFERDSHRCDYRVGGHRRENRSNRRSGSNFERHHSHRSDYREGGRSNRRSGSSYERRDSDRYGHRGDGRRRGANRGNRRSRSSVDSGDIRYNPDRSRSRDRDDDRDRVYNHRYDRTPDRMPGRSDRDSRSPRRGRDRKRGRHNP